MVHLSTHSEDTWSISLKKNENWKIKMAGCDFSCWKGGENDLDFAAWWMEANNKQRASAGGRPLTSPFSLVPGCTSLRVKLIIRLLILFGSPKEKISLFFQGKMCHWAAPNTPVDEWCTWSGWQPPRRPIPLNEDVNFPSKWASVFPLKAKKINFPPEEGTPEAGDSFTF